MNPISSTEKKRMTFSASVSEILYYYDVAGLVKDGALEDEYASEASAIIYRLRDVDDLRSLQWSVYDVFVEFLSKESILPAGDERYISIAEIISAEITIL